MFETSVIELSKSALKNNLNFLREQVGSDCRISSVVKGNAYGHGIDEFVPLAESCGIDHFSVFSSYEALQVKKRVVGDPVVLIMGMLDIEEMEWVDGDFS